MDCKQLRNPRLAVRTSLLSKQNFPQKDARNSCKQIFGSLSLKFQSLLAKWSFTKVFNMEDQKKSLQKPE